MERFFLNTWFKKSKYRDRNMKILMLLTLLLCFGVEPSMGRNNQITTYNVNDGLSQNSVYSFYQDHEGFLWIGTGDGLNRFDGYEFKVFKYQPNKVASLAYRTVRGIVETQDKRIWIGSDKGMSVYDTKTNRIEKCHLFEDSISKTFISPIASYGSYLYFNVYSKGIYRMNVFKGKPELLTHDVGSNTSDKAKLIGEDIWFIDANNDLYKFNIQTLNVQLIDNQIGTAVDVSSICDFNEHTVALATSKGLKFISKNENSPIVFSRPDFLDKANIRSVFRDSKNQIWISSFGVGVYLYDENWQLLKFYDETTDRNTDIPISLANVVTFYEDASGNVWFGTDGAGMGIFHFNSLKFKDHNSINNIAYKLSSNFIKCFYQDEDKVYIGTLNTGLNVIDLTKKRIEYFLVNKKYSGFKNSNSINCIVPAKNKDYLYLATSNNLYRFSKAKKNIELVWKGPDNYNTIFSIVRLGNGRIFFSNNFQLYEIIETENKPTAKEITVFKSNIISLHDDLQGRLVVNNGYGGVTIIDDRLRLIRPETINTYITKQNIKLNSFFFDKTVIWVATTAGLIKLDRDYNILKVYGLEQELPDLFVYGILKDKLNRLWFSSNRGLSCFNPLTEKIKNYTHEDGIQSFEFNSGAFYQNTSGEMFFGGVNGFNYFKPESIFSNIQSPKISLLKVELFDREISKAFLNKHNRLLLPYYKNTLSFDVSALELSYPRLNQYAFKLEGLEDQWFYAGNKRYIRYNALKPGKYKLLVKATNSEGVWGKEERMMAIEILPPFWRSMWFMITSSVLMIGGIAYSTYKISENRYKKKMHTLEREREMLEIRSRISRDIHDDIGAGLTRISILTQRIRNTKKSEKEKELMLEKLNQQSKEIVQNLGEIVWTVNPLHDELNTFIAYIRQYANHFFENTDMDFEMHTCDNLKAFKLNPDLRRNLFLFIKESLNNALKHSEGTLVKIDFENTDSNFQLTISDNGKGICKSNELGNGLKNMKSRIESVRAQLLIESQVGKGTTLIVSGIFY